MFWQIVKSHYSDEKIIATNLHVNISYLRHFNCSSKVPVQEWLCVHCMKLLLCKETVLHTTEQVI